MDEIAIKEEQLMIEEKDIKVGFPKEVWRTISNFTDYEISNIARVRNKKTGFNRGRIGFYARGEGKLKTYKGYEWKYRFE